MIDSRYLTLLVCVSFVVVVHANRAVTNNLHAVVRRMVSRGDVVRLLENLASHPLDTQGKSPFTAALIEVGRWALLGCVCTGWCWNPPPRLKL